MAGDAIQYKGVLILHFALDKPMAEVRCRLLSAGSAAAVQGRQEARCRQSKRLKDLLSRPRRQVFVCKDLERLAQQDESGIGVFAALSRRGLDGQFQAGAIEFRREC